MNTSKDRPVQTSQKERDDNARRVAIGFLRKFSPNLRVGITRFPGSHCQFCDASEPEPRSLFISRTGLFGIGPRTDIYIKDQRIFLSWENMFTSYYGHAEFVSDRVQSLILWHLPHTMPEIGSGVTLNYFGKPAKTVRTFVKALANDMEQNWGSYYCGEPFVQRQHLLIRS